MCESLRVTVSGLPIIDDEGFSGAHECNRCRLHAALQSRPYRSATRQSLVERVPKSNMIISCIPSTKNGVQAGRVDTLIYNLQLQHGSRPGQARPAGSCRSASRALLGRRRMPGPCAFWRADSWPRVVPSSAGRASAWPAHRPPDTFSSPETLRQRLYGTGLCIGKGMRCSGVGAGGPLQDEAVRGRGRAHTCTTGRSEVGPVVSSSQPSRLSVLSRFCVFRPRGGSPNAAIRLAHRQGHHQAEIAPCPWWSSAYPPWISPCSSSARSAKPA